MAFAQLTQSASLWMARGGVTRRIIEIGFTGVMHKRSSSLILMSSNRRGARGGLETVAHVAFKP